MEAAVVPWYLDESSYARFRETAEDAVDFFSSHREWLDVAMEHERRAGAAGVILLRMRMRFEDFEQWRQLRSLPNSCETRTAYAEAQAAQLLPSEMMESTD
jgi:hypothetical protein